MIDFLIIGGGIAGTSAAARLAPLGKTVLLERETSLGYHASGRSAALFEANYGLDSTVALSAASADFHTNAHGGFLSPRGLMLVAKSREKDDFPRACEDMNMEPISLEQAFDIVPILNRDVVGFAAFHEAAYDVDTDREIQTFAKLTRAENGEVLTGQTVTRIQRNGTGWVVTANGTDYETRMIFNASGAWVDEIAKMAGITPLGFTPLRRSMARLPAPGGHDISGWPMMLGVREDWYAKPDAGKLLVSPSEEHLQEPHDTWPDDMVLAEGLARYEEVVTEPVTRVEHSWAGLRTFSPDRNLVLGPSVDDASFYWVSGQGGYGFQTGPAASQLIADLVSGAPSELDATTLAALDPKRFG